MKEKLEQRAKRLNSILEKDHSKIRIMYLETVKGEGYTFLNLEQSTQNFVSPILYLGDWWNKEDQELCGFLKSFYEVAMQDFDQIRCIQQASHLNKEYIKRHVFPRLMSENKKESVKRHNQPYLTYQDMLIGFAIELDDEKSMLIDYNICKQFGISVDELYRWAVDNLDQDFQLKTMCDLMKGFGIPDIAKDLKEKNITVQIEPWVLTNHSMQYGAACILSKKIMKKIEQKLGGELVLLPVSVHEMLIFIYNSTVNLQFLLQAVKEINRTQDPLDVLSDNIYLYTNGEIRRFV